MIVEETGASCYNFFQTNVYIKINEYLCIDT